ncbi:MAG: NADH-quinone oxidoreductase subunit J [Candidimonas sp.]|nr:MAG: NADH-quinone oxidoreductase subunit J [Candidimonas sp.]
MIFNSILFYLFSLVLVIAAFRVITANNPVTGVLHLILAFFTAAMLWILLNAEFLALLLVLVYVGAVMVLFLFVVMMLDFRDGPTREGLKAYLPLGLVIGIVMVLEMAFVVIKSWAGADAPKPLPANYDNTHALGVAMYSHYLFAVEVGAVILLVGMVSAIALTLRHRRDAKFQRPGDQVRVRARDRLRLVDLPSQTEHPPAPAEAPGVPDPAKGEAK